MTLILDDEETSRLAQEVAELAGEPVQLAVRAALAERKARLQQRGKPSRAELMLEAAREFAALPDIDSRTPDEIIGYDEIGMWR